MAAYILTASTIKRTNSLLCMKIEKGLCLIEVGICQKLCIGPNHLTIEEFCCLTSVIRITL